MRAKIHGFMIFIMGFIAALNFSELMPAAPGFEGSWAAIILYCLMASYFLKCLEVGGKEEVEPIRHMRRIYDEKN